MEKFKRPQVLTLGLSFLLGAYNNSQPTDSGACRMNKAWVPRSAMLSKAEAAEMEMALPKWIEMGVPGGYGGYGMH